MDGHFSTNSNVQGRKGRAGGEKQSREWAEVITRAGENCIFWWPYLELRIFISQQLLSDDHLRKTENRLRILMSLWLFYLYGFDSQMNLIPSWSGAPIHSC